MRQGMGKRAETSYLATGGVCVSVTIQLAFGKLQRISCISILPRMGFTKGPRLGNLNRIKPVNLTKRGVTGGSFGNPHPITLEAVELKLESSKAANALAQAGRLC